MTPVVREEKESTNTVESRPKTFVLHATKPITKAELMSFLQEIAPSTYRMKGFVETEDGITEVSTVGEQIQLLPWSLNTPKLEVVIISSVGIRMMSILTKAFTPSIKEKLHL